MIERDMLACIESVTRTLALLVFCGGAALAQSADITGWNGLSWGTQKPAASGALRPLRAHECSPCSDADSLVIEAYRQNGVSYQVKLVFRAKQGLTSVTMSSADDRETFQKVLADLTARFGRPGLQSEYDGDREVTRTKWEWAKPHGKVSLSADDGDGSSGLFTIRYEARMVAVQRP